MTEKIESVERLYVRYDGNALRSHEMDVRQLAPALLALSDAFDVVQANVAPTSNVHLKAKATREGSFVIDLIVQLMNDAESLFVSEPVSAIVNAAGLLEILIEAVKYITHLANGRKPVKTTPEPSPSPDEPAKFEVEYADGTKMVWTGISMELATNPKFVDTVKPMVKPTLHDGIDNVQISSTTDVAQVSSEEADAIMSWDPLAREQSTSKEEIVIQALDVSFRPNGKWRITDGTKTQFVELEDEAFVKRVLDGDEAMRANDIYRVLMRVEKKLDDNNRLIKKYVAIVKVISHTAAEEQPRLF